MLILYIYHIRRRRTWTEEQHGRRTWTWRLCCCCVVPWRRGAAAWAQTLEEYKARASTSKIVMVRAQYTLRGSCLRTFCFFLLSIPACLSCHVAGFLRCHVWRKMWAVQSTIPQTPSRPPRVVHPAELNYRGACEFFQSAWKRELVSWARMADGSHKRREGACFFGD